MLVGFVDFVVKDGVRPAPVPIASELRRMMGIRHDSRESFLVSAGMMVSVSSFPTGSGSFYMMQGNTLLTVDLHDVEWQG